MMGTIYSNGGGSEDQVHNKYIANNLVDNMMTK